MQVLFIKKYKKYHASDIADVKEGFFTNYLKPQNIAIKATQINQDLAKKLKATKEIFDTYKGIVKAINKKTITLHKKAADSSLYAAVREDDIVSAIKKELEQSIEARFVSLSSPIKNLGKHEINIVFDESITASLTLNVLAQEDEAIEGIEEELAKKVEPVPSAKTDEETEDVPAEAEAANDIIEAKAEETPISDSEASEEGA